MAKNLKATTLGTLEVCPRKASMETLALNQRKSTNYHIAVAMKGILATMGLEKDNNAPLINPSIESLVEKAINEVEQAYVEEGSYLTVQAKSKLIETKTTELSRYLKFIMVNQYVFLERNIVDSVEVKGKQITVSADAIVKTQNGIEVIRFKTSKPQLSYAGQKETTRVDRNIQLYLLKLLGEKRYPTEKVSGAFYHMESKNDKQGEMDAVFNLKKGNNIVSSDFKDTGNLVEEKIIALTSQLDMDVISNEREKCADCDKCPFLSTCEFEKVESLKLREVPTQEKASSSFTLLKEQEEIVNFDKGIGRLNAGAGVGKTTVIAIRTVELIEKGVHPSKILLITFTNKGAKEMIEKINYWLKKNNREDIDASTMNIMTFNTWGNQVIEENYKLFGFTQAPRLIDKISKYDIIFELLDIADELEGSYYANPLMDFTHAKGVVVEVSEMIDVIKSKRLYSTSQILEEFNITETKAQQVYDLYNAFEAVLKEQNFIQYQDQINLMVDAIEDNPEIIQSKKFEHIVVDEFQDTDAYQLDIINALTENEGFQSLLVVGDDFQSIFQFKGCTPQIMIDFDTYFDEIHDFYMLKNFRSNKPIIDLGNKVIELNTNQIKKTLKATKKDGEMPLYKECNRVEDEINFIVEKIRNSLTPLQDIAVLARTRSELLAIQEALEKANIPSIIDIPEPFIENKNIAILIEFMDFIENHDNELALFNYLYAQDSTIAQLVDIEKVKEIVAQKKEIIAKQFEDCATENERLELVFRLLRELNPENRKILGFIEELEEMAFSTIRGLILYLRRFRAYKEDRSIEDEPKRYQAVYLLTTHASKGKEFEEVYLSISKFDKGNTFKIEDIEETRRLLFVGITRAKEQLTITTQRYLPGIKRAVNFLNQEIVSTQKILTVG